ncbi:MAG TPA: hypothetical protein H9881_18960 [Candidatus Stackebrandtia excrementipullorum]|nr:hypothetical protein [Candidatus Stackebrandtia excrementipullorum]
MNHHTQAHAHVTATLAAAAWRENLTGLRDRAAIQNNTIHTTTHAGNRLTFTATLEAFNQITPYGPVTHNGQPITDPTVLLTLLAPHADPIELTDAVEGLTLAFQRHEHIVADHRRAARRLGAATSIQLAQHLQQNTNDHLICRHFEPLAVTGHHLHPGARTRLGWNHHDRLAYDLEANGTTDILFLALDRRQAVSTTDGHGRDIDAVMATWFPPLTEHLSPDRILIPTHPWQHRHATAGTLRPLTETGHLTDVPQLRLPAEPTASIRTLVTRTGHYLKCSLDIHITSTRRGISPATAANGPVLSRTIIDLIGRDATLAPHITVLPEIAAVSLPHHHPASRDLTCILRAPLTDHLQPGELAVPATALCARSPISGRHLISELALQHPHQPAHFLEIYATKLLDTTIRLATEYGIGMEAHLQNCIPTFIDATLHRVILRDLGGARIHLPTLHRAGYKPPLHPASVTTTDDITEAHTKVAYTVLQNHLAAIVTAMEADDLLHHATAWKIITDIVADIAIPDATRNFYTAPTLPHKALLHMRLMGDGDHHVPVDNPLHQSS